MPKADGSISFSVELDDKEAQQKLTRLTRKIDTLRDSISKNKAFKLPLVEQSEKLGAALDAAKAKLEEMQQAGLGSEALKAQQEAVNVLQAQWNSMTAKVERYDQAITKSEQELSWSENEAGELAQRLAGAEENTNGLSAATERAEENMEKFVNRIKKLAGRVFVFTLITQGLRSIRDYMWKAIKTNDEAVAAVARLKGALLTLAQPIINVIIPAFTTLVNMLARIVDVISSVVSSIAGTTVEQSAQSAEALYDEQQALDGVGASAKKAGKSLASFDEINKLSSDSDSGSASSISPDFKQTIQGGLNSILELFAGAALLALGAILTFSGANILLGIGLMALGAAFIWDAITSDSNLAVELVKSGLDEVLQAIGSMIAIIGVILIVAGHWGLGIGLLIAGIALWAVGAAASDGGSFADNVKKRLMSALELISPLIAILGVVLIVTGHLLTGIALLIAGIALFAISAVSDQGNVTVEKVTASLGLLASIVGGFLAILGVMLLCFGQISMGAGLLIAGIALFGVGQAALNYELLKNNITDGLTRVLEVVGAFLFVIGLILAFIPGMEGFGFGAMAAGIGAVGVSALLPNWDYILECLQGAWRDIVNWWNETVIGALSNAKETIAGFGHGIVEKLKDVLGIHSPSTETSQMGEYMMIGMANGITENQHLVLDVFQLMLYSLTLSYQTWEMNFTDGFTAFKTAFSEEWLNFWSLVSVHFTIKWNEILQTLQQGCNNAIDALNRLVDAANSLAELTGRRYWHVGRITVPSIPIPALAEGAVIPPNREFLAVLGDQKSGTNIETPLSTMVQAFRQVLSEGGYSGQNEVYLMLDDVQLGKVIYRLNKSESNRVGVDLSEV